MKSLASPAQRPTNPLSASVMLHALAAGLARSIGMARTYQNEHRNARAAEELHRHLSQLSDAELARRGLHRDQLLELVKGRF
jgi:hypothetical protein